MKKIIFVTGILFLSVFIRATAQAVTETVDFNTYISPTTIKILGLDPEYFLGKSAFSLVHPDDVELIKGVFARIGTQKFSKTPPFRFKYADGEWKWIESSISNLLQEDGVIFISIDDNEVHNLRAVCN